MPQMNRIALIRRRLDERQVGARVTEQQFVEAVRRAPKPPSPVPPQADDSADYYAELVTIRPDHRRKVGLPPVRPERAGRPVRLPRPDIAPSGRTGLFYATNVIGSDLFARGAQPDDARGRVSDDAPAIPQPVLRIRIHAFACRNGDGRFSDGGEPQTKEQIGEGIAKMIAEVNTIYKTTGIEFVFYPQADVEIVNDTGLNQDFLVPDDSVLTQEPPLTKDKMDQLTGNDWSTDPRRNEAASKRRGKLALMFAEGTTYSFGVPETQDQWRFCKKCRSLFYGGSGSSACPAGGAHDATDSGNYMLIREYGEIAKTTQDNWRWCSKCQSFNFRGFSAGPCPAGGTHDTNASWNYQVFMDESEARPNSQDGWSWCDKCQGLFFATGGSGACAAGGAHDGSSSAKYRLMFQQQLANRWIVQSPAGGGFSWADKEFAKLSEWVDPADAKGYATFAGHEMGHHLHLWHTFVQFSLQTDDEKNADVDKRIAILESRIREHLNKQLDAGVASADTVKSLDGDKDVIGDTLPDDSGQLLSYMNEKAAGGDADACGTIATVTLKLKDGSTVSYSPERDLVMSYFKHCTNFAQRFSPNQAERMRDALINGNRRHLVGVQLGDTSTPAEKVAAVWDPNTNNQRLVWHRTFDQFQAECKEMIDKNFRLRFAQAYFSDGVLRYDGVWNPGTLEERLLFDLDVDQFKTRYDELAGQSFRLTHFESYLDPDGQIRMNGIFHASNTMQDWIQGFTKEDFVSHWTGQQAAGFHLAHLNSWNLPDGQVRYDGLFNPGTHDEPSLLGAPPQDFQKKYGELWNENFKLKMFDVHMTGGGPRYDAVWQPNPNPQYVIWNATREQVAQDYDEMWQQGMRLSSMSMVRVS